MQKQILLQEIEDVPEEMLRETVDFIRFLKQQRKQGMETALASESALKKDWLTPEEDAAWQNL
jgi:hypothetical protein